MNSPYQQWLKLQEHLFPLGLGQPKAVGGIISNNGFGLDEKCKCGEDDHEHEDDMDDEEGDGHDDHDHEDHEDDMDDERRDDIEDDMRGDEKDDKVQFLNMKGKKMSKGEDMEDMDDDDDMDGEMDGDMDDDMDGEEGHDHEEEDGDEDGDEHDHDHDHEDEDDEDDEDGEGEDEEAEKYGFMKKNESHHKKGCSCKDCSKKCAKCGMMKCKCGMMMKKSEKKSCPKCNDKMRGKCGKCKKAMHEQSFQDFVHDLKTNYLVHRKLDDGTIQDFKQSLKNDFQTFKPIPVQEDLLISPEAERLLPDATEPRPGEVGYAPTQRFGIGGSQIQESSDYKVLCKYFDKDFAAQLVRKKKR